MNYRKVKRIFLREVRDQLRDRRTLFIIAILPILLYPILGMSMFQMVQFMQEHPTKVLVIGGQQMLTLNENGENLTPLFVKEAAKPDEAGSDAAPPSQTTIFSPKLFRDDELSDREKRSKLLELTFFEDLKGVPKNVDPKKYADDLVSSGKFDAAIYFPPNFAQQLKQYRKAFIQHGKAEGGNATEEDASADSQTDSPQATVKVPEPSIFHTTTSERSTIAAGRLKAVQHNWVTTIGRQNLIAAGLPNDVTKPFNTQSEDLAKAQGKSGAATWAKLLPLMLILWALTGAFYPAVDLCAGEKERGTLETLLCSPAQRSEIVMGKLGTVMLFSIMTAVLNIVSIGITGWFLISNVPLMGDAMGSPPWMALVWIVPVLLPVAALFSAVCVALAAFAKSSKEGQYYLMPVLLVVLPLAMLPMAPNVELNLGTSLIPITNICLLLSVLIKGQYLVALKFLLPVVIVTLFCCLFAIRWAIDQFKHESVMFSESERLDLWLRVRNLFRYRHPTPTFATAALAGALILLLKFFIGSAMSPPTNFDEFARLAIVSQVALFLMPALLMTFMFTTSRAKTLLLGREAWNSRIPWAILMAFMLAVVGHPLAITFQHFITTLYPAPDLSGFDEILKGAPSFVVILLLLAVLPAICEELAFRGFILSGFRHTGSKWRAIALTAVLFGMTHGILQQSIIAATVGLVIGYLAVQSGNLLIPIVYHVTHNSLAFCLAIFTKKAVSNSEVFGGVMAYDSSIAKGFVYMANEFAHYFMVWGPGDKLPHYDWRLVFIAALIFAIILDRFSRFRYTKTDEEKLKLEIARNQRLDG